MAQYIIIFMTTPYVSHPLFSTSIPQPSYPIHRSFNRAILMEPQQEQVYEVHDEILRHLKELIISYLLQLPSNETINTF